MQRETKFRGKGIDTGEWLYGNLITNDGKPYIVGDVVESTEDYISLEYWWPVDPETVGQYTGLKDKNGKEIFEEILLGQVGVVIKQSWYGKEKLLDI